MLTTTFFYKMDHFCGVIIMPPKAHRAGPQTSWSGPLIWFVEDELTLDQKMNRSFQTKQRLKPTTMVNVSHVSHTRSVLERRGGRESEEG